jgi:hypothetical protein
VGSLAALFGVSFLLNLAWEFAHVRLYTTKVTSLFLVWQSAKDALWITLAYALVQVLRFDLSIFVLGLLVFSWVVERHALATKRWEYGPVMPIVLGVGLSPLLELALTGSLAVLSLRLLGM